MALTPITFEGFGGLNLTSDPFEVGATGAVDALNVWIREGRIDTVGAVSNHSTAPTATRAIQRIYAHRDDIVLSESDGTNTTLEAYQNATTAVATTYASTNTTAHSFATIGSTSSTRTYAVRQGDTTRRWDGTSWTSVAGVPAGSCAAPATFGSRLAVGASGGNVNRVSFSNAGDPETFGANDWVDLTPGDGDFIIDMVSWREMLFVFKSSKFFVFYGESTDADGGAIFNYRPVDVGVGIGRKGTGGNGGACAGRDGVYFIGPDGVYRTTGDVPELVSPQLRPLWPGQLAADTTVPRVAPVGTYLNGADIEAVGPNIYLSIAAESGTKKLTFVLIEGRAWTYLNIQENSTNISGGNFIAGSFGPVFSRPGSTTLRELDLNNMSTSLPWWWTSGKYRLAEAGRVAITLESSVIGSGTVLMDTTTDLYGTTSGAAASLATAPATSEGWVGLDQEGSWFQHRLYGSGAGSVSSLTHHVRSVKPAGVR